MIIKHVEGNPMSLAIPLSEKVRRLIDGVETDTEGEFIPLGDVTVNLISVANRYSFTAEVEGNVVIVSVEGIKVGTYSLEVLCKDQQDNNRRYYQRGALQVVKATADAGIEAGVEFDAETYTIEGTVFFYAKGDKGDKGDKGNTELIVRGTDETIYPDY